MAEQPPRAPRPANVSRRTFLRTATIAGGALAAPTFLRTPASA